MEINVEEALSIRDNFEKYKGVESVLIKGDKFNVAPIYSIVIPTYKRASTLKMTLESALNQDYRGAYNIIVCDNNPERNDETENYMLSVKDSRILYYKNSENIGMTGNWNRCVELCDGKYMLMVHDDDILYPSFISQCEKILKAEPDVDFIFPRKQVWNEIKEKNMPDFDQIRKMAYYKVDNWDYLLDNPDAPTGALFKKEAIIKIGGWYENTYPTADYYFNVKAVNHLNVYRYDQSLVIYRWSVNASLKLRTIIGFIETCTPVKKWISEQIKIPTIIKKSIIRTNNLLYKNFAKKYCPKEYNSDDFIAFELPSSRIEGIFYAKLLAIFSSFISFRRKKTYL